MWMCLKVQYTIRNFWWRTESLLIIEIIFLRWRKCECVHKPLTREYWWILCDTFLLEADLVDILLKGITYRLGPIRKWSNTTIHASGNIRVVFLSFFLTFQSINHMTFSGCGECAWKCSSPAESPGGGHNLLWWWRLWFRSWKIKWPAQTLNKEASMNSLWHTSSWSWSTYIFALQMRFNASAYTKLTNMIATAPVSCLSASSMLQKPNLQA